ncbi:MAG: GntR family transcriptional regulator [Singulisphaera sp.]
MTDASISFEIQPSSGVPIYRQIMDQVRAQVASERLAAGAMLPSIRQLATDLEVNMMTVSKAYARLEADGVLERVRGTGMRVRRPTTLGSVAERQAELAPLAESLVTRAAQLNLTERQALAVVKKVLQERRTWLKQSSTSAS